MTSWGPESRSYPLRIIGDTNSAVVMMVDTPDMFGDEIRAVAALDFRNGKILRQVDYWDGRRNAVIGGRVPDDQYPSTFGESVVRTKPNSVIQTVSKMLSSALSKGNSTAAAELFTSDGILEDFSIRARVEGQKAIERYLKRASHSLPYGSGSSLRHVVGSIRGGGYEWINQEGAGRNGIIAIELNLDGQIIRLSSVWDASKASNTTMDTLAGHSIEP